MIWATQSRPIGVAKEWWLFRSKDFSRSWTSLDVSDNFRFQFFCYPAFQEYFFIFLEAPSMSEMLTIRSRCLLEAISRKLCSWSNQANTRLSNNASPRRTHEYFRHFSKMARSRSSNRLKSIHLVGHQIVVVVA